MLESLMAGGADGGMGDDDDSLRRSIAELATHLIGEREGQSFLVTLVEQIDSLSKRTEVLKKKLVDATSHTSTSTSLRDVVLQGELEKVLEQRGTLAGLLILLCETRELGVDDILRLLEWTSQFDSADDLGVHITTACLIALSPMQIVTPTVLSNLTDERLIASLLKHFEKEKKWKSAGVKSALQLQCSLFLVACRAQDPTMCDEKQATVDAIESMATESMENDAFVFLDHLVLAARGRDSLIGGKTPTLDAAQVPTAGAGTDLVDEPFRSKVYLAVEGCIIGLLVSLPNVLKRLKHRQEDVGIAARKVQTGTFVNALGRKVEEPAPAAQPAPLRTDIAALFRLIGTLYDSLPVESALKFWIVQTSGKSKQIDPLHSRLPSFLRWAAESRGEVMVPAVYDMLAGLAKGTACSEHAYNFLSTGGVASGALAGMQVSYGSGAFSCDFLSEGPAKLEKGAIKSAYFESCMRRVVRIVHRVLDVQSFFLEMLVPAIQSFDFSSILTNFMPGQLIALDRHLLFNHTLVERIALLVTLPSPEIQLLSIRILGMLALSPNFTIMDQQASRMARRLNRLAAIIQNSDDSVRINDGFAALLGTDSAEVAESEDFELYIGAGAPARDEGAEDLSLTHTIRLEIIDLLLKNTEKGRPSPNIAHLLLGFDVATASTNEMAIQDPSALNSTTSCFHVITDLLSDGIPLLDSTRRRREEQSLSRTPLYFKAPLLAEKCHRLFHQLCSHELTSKPAARYLRTREDYFARNLAALPIRAPEIPVGKEGMASYADGVGVESNCSALTSFLRMRSWLLESVALEIHLLTDEKQFPRAGRLLDILFGSIDVTAETFEDDVGDRFFGSSTIQAFSPGQSLMRVVEIFQSFDLTWQDSMVSLEAVPLVFYGSLDYSSCLRAAESGAEVIDRDALIGLLSQIRRAREETETLSPEALEQLSHETRYLLESCVRENNRREIEHAKAMGFESWRRVVNVALAKCFDRLSIESREGILFDLLQEVPPVIRQPSLSLPSSVLLSEVTMMLITKLREDRSHRALVQSFTDDANYMISSLPEDRFHGILRSLLDSLLASGMPEIVRGNL
ncbi:hypothetical protein FRC15_003293, partial [Serendipita sp. 397]